VPPVEPLHTAPFLPCDGTTFWIGARLNWNGGAAHVAPRRMIFVTMRGAYTVETTDGSVKRFPPGSVLIVEDTTGTGHSSWITGDEDMVVLATGLPA
jgi:hypothetical protein